MRRFVEGCTDTETFVCCGCGHVSYPGPWRGRATGRRCHFTGGHVSLGRGHFATLATFGGGKAHPLLPPSWGRGLGRAFQLTSIVDFQNGRGGGEAFWPPSIVDFAKIMKSLHFAPVDPYEKQPIYLEKVHQFAPVDPYEELPI